MKVILGLSGGMDSAALAAYYLNKGDEVVPVSFNYGSKHNPYECLAACRIAEYYGLPTPIYIELPFISGLFKSNLLQGQGDIPEGYYKDDSMSQTVVPNRNMIFASIMVGLAESLGAQIVALGVHSGDHHIYPDCRPEFINALNITVAYSTEKKVRIEAPFLEANKFQILVIGYSTLPKVPWELTRTCYKDQYLSCGKCGSCIERLEAFSLYGETDPIEYATVSKNKEKRIPRL